MDGAGGSPMADRGDLHQQESGRIAWPCGRPLGPGNKIVITLGVDSWVIAAA
jgi:hypothetical protein